MHKRPEDCKRVYRLSFHLCNGSIGRLRIGAAGQLQMTGALKTRPAEDKAAHEAARPVRENGEVIFDPMLNDAREDAIVKNVLAGGPVSVLILSGAHDLSNNVPEGCQYIRVGTKAYEAIAGK